MYYLQIFNEEYKSENIEELKPILFEFMKSEGYTDFTYKIVSKSDLTEHQIDLTYNDLTDNHIVHFFGECFILQNTKGV